MNFDNSRSGKVKYNRPHDTHRCVVCNAVNFGEIETDLGDMSYKTWTETSYGLSGVPAFVCHECENSHREVMSEWDIEDQFEEDFEEFEDD